MKATRLPLLLAFLLPSIAVAQTGKIAGTVTDPAGEPLAGVNVAIVGTTVGAVTDVDGYYAILNVSPDTYDLRASFIGFAAQIKQDVRVNIGLTTTVDFQLNEEAVGMQEIVVEAAEPIIRPDISANVANLNAEEMENLPVSGMEDIIGLQAGAEGLSIRGSDLDELNIMVDGLTLRDGRDNTPARNSISLTAIEAVQLQTGGFNAEYGNVRSALVNVVTKEGPRNRYIADVIVRYSPASEPYFGIAPNDATAFHMRPYLDPEVAFEGTQNWDFYTRAQYPDFEGFNAISQRVLGDADPSNDLTPEQAQQVWLWQHRKDFDVAQPDYNIDASFGGPVPLISRPLGNLRFFASFRQTQTAYITPNDREAYKSRSGQFKLTSDLASGLKLTLEGLLNNEYGLAQSTAGEPGMYRAAHGPAGVRFSGLLHVDHVLFSDAVINPQDIQRNVLGFKLTHTLNPSTFYTVTGQRNVSDYSALLPRMRDTTTVQTIGAVELDEYPMGWLPTENWATSRDSSEVAIWSGRFDLTSQLNRYSQLKTGLELIYSNYSIFSREVSPFPNNFQPITDWERSPVQGAAYVQNKLEFEGLIANVGLRLDYYDPTDTWYEWDPYSRAFSNKYKFEGLDEIETIDEASTKSQVYLSPRVGISYPITTNNKLFFNYGHFRQVLDPNVLFNVRMDNFGYVNLIGNPDHPMTRTIAYELGYEQNLFNQLLLRVTGYYKALDNQPRAVYFTNFKGDVNYGHYLPHNYEDIRGLEISLNKNVGRYFRGFANFTYMVVKRGNFGLERFYENRTLQREYVRTTTDHYQAKPVPEPYARASLEFFSPDEFGPSLGGAHPLGDIRLNLLGSWRAGDVFTWNGGGPPIQGLQNNVRWSDSYNLDLRLSKNIATSAGEAQLYVDVSNVLNTRRLQRVLPFENTDDYHSYMESLHLPADIFDELEQPPYAFVPGDDRPGDVRPDDVAFQPIEAVQSIAELESGQPRALYYETDTGQYMTWTDGAWSEADPNQVQQVLDDKAYIDMPNVQYLRYLYPRDVTFGMRLTF